MKEFGGSERQQMSVHSAASRASASVHIAQSLDAAVNKRSRERVSVWICL